MNTAKIKSEIIALANYVRERTDTLTALSIAMRYADEPTVRELLGTEAGGHGIEEILQRLRVELGSLDRALCLVGEELVGQIRLIERGKQNGSTSGPLN